MRWQGPRARQWHGEATTEGTAAEEVGVVLRSPAWGEKLDSGARQWGRKYIGRRGTAGHEDGTQRTAWRQSDGSEVAAADGRHAQWQRGRAGGQRRV